MSNGLAAPEEVPELRVWDLAGGRVRAGVAWVTALRFTGFLGWLSEGGWPFYPTPGGAAFFLSKHLLHAVS